MDNIAEMNKKLDNKLGQSSLLLNWDLEDNIKAPLELDSIQKNYEKDENSYPVMADMIQNLSIQQEKKKPKKIMPDDQQQPFQMHDIDLDKDKEGLIPMTEEEIKQVKQVKSQAPSSLFIDNTAGNYDIDIEQINKMSQQIKEKMALG